MEANVIPRVTVLIDTYNHERFIERAITSVLEQDMPMDEVEILVVDDGSTDRTPEIVRGFGPRICLLRKANGGQASAFNAGIPACHGEIIAFLDGDDWWAPGKLRRVLEVMLADPSLGIVGHSIVESSDDGAERIIAMGAPERLRLDSIHAAKAFRLHRCFFGTSRMTLRSQIARKILPVPEALVFEADEYIFTIANALADGFILNEPLTYYRVHAGNLFLNSGGNRAGERRKLQVLICLAAELRRALPACGMADYVAAPILEMVQAEADQLRLKLEGGNHWQTYQVESTIYRIQHGDASWRQRFFHEVMMLPALILPPRLFYGIRQWLASRPWYKQARQQHLPAPGFTHIHASEAQPEHPARSDNHE